MITQHGIRAHERSLPEKKSSTNAKFRISPHKSSHSHPEPTPLQ